MSDGNGKRPPPQDTVTDLEPVPEDDEPALGGPGDTLDAPTDSTSRVPPTIPLLDAVPDGPGWSLDEASGPHQNPTARKPSRLDVVAAEPSKPRSRRLPRRGEADAFESDRSEPSLEAVESSGTVETEESTLWFWVALGALLLVAVVLVVVVFF